MSIEAEIIIEQLKDQLHQDVYNLQQELENTVSFPHFSMKPEVLASEIVITLAQDMFLFN